MRDVRVGDRRDVADDDATPVHASLRRAQRLAAEHMASKAAHVVERRFPELKRGLEIWSVLLGDATVMSFAERLGEGRLIAVYRELLRWAFGRSPHTLPALGLAVAADVTHVIERVSPRRLDEARALGVELRAALDQALGEDGVMLCPSYAEPRHVAPRLPPTRGSTPPSSIPRRRAVSSNITRRWTDLRIDPPLASIHSSHSAASSRSESASLTEIKFGVI